MKLKDYLSTKKLQIWRSGKSSKQLVQSADEEAAPGQRNAAANAMFIDYETEPGSARRCKDDSMITTSSCSDGGMRLRRKDRGWDHRGRPSLACSMIDSLRSSAAAAPPAAAATHQSSACMSSCDPLCTRVTQTVDRASQTRDQRHSEAASSDVRMQRQLTVFIEPICDAEIIQHSDDINVESKRTARHRQPLSGLTKQLPELVTLPQLPTDETSAASVDCQHFYNSLPSSQSSSHQLMAELQYNSLPLSMTESCYVSGSERLAENREADSTNTSQSASRSAKRHRSKIRTNPWIQPPTSVTNYQRRQLPEQHQIRRPEPRLSKCIYEVEQILRNQCLQDDVGSLNAGSAPDDVLLSPADALLHRSDSSFSLASTCSTATEIPEKLIDYEDGHKFDTVIPHAHSECQLLRSPSEGYTSACSSICSSINVTTATTADRDDCCSLSESFSSDDIISSSSHHLDEEVISPVVKAGMNADVQELQQWIKNNNDDDGSCNIAAGCDSKLSETDDSTDHNVSGSMFSSTLSIRSEAFQERVRRLCESTCDLEEKIRLARLERSYIKVPN